MPILKKLFNEHYKKIDLTEQDIQKKYTYINVACKETTDNLEKKILDILEGDDISILNIKNELAQLKIESYQKNYQLNEYYNFLSFLIDHIKKDRNHNEKILKSFNNTNDWKKAIDIYSEWQNINSMDYISFTKDISPREKMIANVSKELKKYNIEIKDGKFNLDEKKIEKIINDIEEIIFKTGGEFFLIYIFNELKNINYDNCIQRYLLPKKYFQFAQNEELALPYNYLINLSLKYIHIRGESQYKKNKYIEKAINLSKRLSFLYDLQDFNNINVNMFPVHWDINTIYKNILYDNVFRFKQMSPDKIVYILSGLFKDMKKIENKLNFTLTEYINLLEKLYQQPKQSIIKYPSVLFSPKELDILNTISHNSDKINSNYKSIKNAKNITFFDKPLIKINNDYLLIDKNYCAWNFYEVILKLLGYPDIGTNIENLIYTSLKNQQHKLYKGNYTNSLKEDAECDIVIETDEYIIFIEVKKKAITSLSVEGNETKIAEDIIDSFIHSQEQMIKHEFSIKKDKKINFDDGDILYLNNKEIVKVSISLFDNNMLNDKMMALNIFEFFQKIRFINPDKKLEEKNRKIENIVEKMNILYENNSLAYREDRHNIYFLSVELFLYFLQFNKPIEDLLKDIRNISFLTGDIYYEYRELLKIKNYKTKAV
jgi:Holliday junction resolvase-like predicted endonuclease